MLTHDELVHLFIKQGIPPTGRAVVEHIRASEPVRRVGGGARNVTTRFASFKMGRVIQAESHKVELPLLYQCEHDPDVLEFWDQPSQVKLSYKSASGRKTTFLSSPDFFLITADWMGWVECKPEDHLVKEHANGSERFIPDGRGGWRCVAGEEFAAQFGLGFRVFSSKSINWILVRNLEFLSDYLRTPLPEVPPPEQDAVWQQFDGPRWLFLEALLNAPGVTADAVYALIATGKLFVDLEHELFSEPRFTKVYRDKLSLEAYREHRRFESNHELIPLHSLMLQAGTALLWDGNPWTILNVGDKQVVMEDERHAITCLDLDQFQKLVASGSLTGVASQVDDPRETAKALLTKAAPVDLQCALDRLRLLESAETGSGKIPDRTLRYLKKRYRDAELAYGNAFLGLIPRISARGNRDRVLKDDVLKIMEDVIKEEVMSVNKTAISVCWGMVRKRCKEKGLIAPSEKTFRAEVKRQREKDLIEAREGKRAAYANSDFHWTLDQSTPRHGERPFEIGHIDHTQLDIELVDSLTGANLGRPWLTLLIDAFTRVILAFYITFDSPSYRSCMGVIRHAIQRHLRIPKTIVVDKGSDFAALYFEALIASMGSHKKSRPTAQSRFGSVVERLFGINNQALIHNLAGNNQALQRPRTLSPSHDPRKHAVWTLPAFTDAFDDFVDNTYANLIHSSLGITPKEAMAQGLQRSGLREHVLIPYDDNFVLLCMPTTPAGKAVVRPGRGFKVRHIHYWNPVLKDAKVERTKVDIKYDPFDASRAYAMVNGTWVLCRSEFQPVFERRTEKEIALMTQEIRRLHQLAEGKNRAINAERIAEYFMQARESEAVLRQQRRDAERRAQDPQTPSGPSSSADHGSRSESANDKWKVPSFIPTFEAL